MAIFSYGSAPPPPPPPPYNTTPPPSRTPSRSRSGSINIMPTRGRNRSLSTRTRKDTISSQTSEKSVPRHGFTMNSLRGLRQPDLSKRLYKLIKSEKHAISAYETAGRERTSIATQLSEWGEDTGDDAVSDISDKLGVLLAEIAEQEDSFSLNLKEYRDVLKQIRNTESSVQPSRDHKAKVSEEIHKLKYKEPQSTKIPQLEQELVRAEAQNLVAEAQLTNITRQKLKEAFDIHTAATIARAEKQILLAKQARRLINFLDDTPIVPGDSHAPYMHGEAARQILTDAEDDLRNWHENIEKIHFGSIGLGAGGVVTHSPTSIAETAEGYEGYEGSEAGSTVGMAYGGYGGAPQQVQENIHPAFRKGEHARSFSQGSRASSIQRTPQRRVTGSSLAGSEISAV